jgi:TolB-like protein/cytochrome c-type biogenesis protein CcmH/NrfG
MLHSPHRWKQIESLFHESLDVPTESRPGFLKERCGDDLELRTEVETLLESEGKSLDFIEQPVINAAHAFTRGSPSNRISPGEVIGHYEIVSFIGAGGMGQVYLAQDVLLGRKVAVKILAPALVNNERGLRRFEKEARAASALNHPNILTIYEFGLFNGLHFIASEYVEGPTLRQTLDGHSLSLAASIDIAVQIGKALEASHASGIVHRDIKPENVMIRGDGLVKVLDFGIVKLIESDSRQSNYPAALASSISISQAGLVIGSARYMSPEQARGLEVDPRSDIFSLGVVLYEMIAGKAAFDGETISDVIAEILKGTPQKLSEIVPDTPPEIQDILAKAMCKDREKRYQTVKEMLADLQHASGAIQLQGERSGVTEARNLQAHPAIGQSGKLKIASVEPGAIAIRSGWSRSRIVRVAISVVFAALVIIGAAFVARSRVSAPSSAQMRPRTLAILPFRNLRQDPSLDYLGFSLSDAVITKLGSVSALTVRPSSSIDRYRNQSVDPQRAGDELNVDTMLTGGFIKDGDDLRITTQLIDLKPNKILWRDSIDVKFDKLLTVQDRVSQEIVKGLELNLTPAEAQTLHPDKPVNAQAYEDYLRGIDFYSMNDFAAAIAMLEKSASIDPNYALTWAHLGKAYTTSATLQLGGREQYDKAQAAYLKAIALSPKLPEPRIYMANMLTDTGRVEQAVPLLRTALETSPNNAELHWELGYAYRFAGMLPESVAECERARQIDPEVKINSSAMNSYLYLGQYAQFLQSLPEQDTAYILFYRGLGEYYLHHSDQAAHDFDRAYTMEPSLLPASVGKAISFSIAGRHAAALELLRHTEDRMEERGVSDAESMYKVAQAYAVLGDKPAALHLLSHTIEGGFFCYSCFATDPLLADLRTLPEFQRLSERARQRQDEFKAQFF